MQQQKLYKWLLAPLAVVFLASCARTNYPGRNTDPREEDEVYYPDNRHLPPGQAKKVYGERSARVFAPGQQRKMQPPYGYQPPAVIIISDHLASSNSNGELYYDNEYGYRYWRNCDGKYYLDAKYDRNVGYEDRRYEKKRKKGRGHQHDGDDD